MTNTTLNLTDYLADHSAETLRGLRVTGTTSGGTEYVGTVGDRIENLYVRIDVDSGGWVRSDSTLTLTDEPHVIEGPNGVTATVEGDGEVWLVTATETETDEQLAQWSSDEPTWAFGVAENVAGSDLSDF